MLAQSHKLARLGKEGSNAEKRTFDFMVITLMSPHLIHQAPLCSSTSLHLDNALPSLAFGKDLALTSTIPVLPDFLSDIFLSFGSHDHALPVADLH